MPQSWLPFTLLLALGLFPSHGSTRVVDPLASSTSAVLVCRSNPITLDQIELLLAEEVSLDDIVDQVDIRGVVPFAFTDTVRGRLIEKGAESRLLYVIAMKLGQANQTIGEFRAAVEAFEIAGRISPNLPHPLFYRALLWRSHSQLDRAIEILDEAITIDPSFLPSYQVKYEILIEASAFDLALDMAHAFQQQFDESYFGYSAIALLKAASPIEEMRDGEEAVSYSKRAYELIPDDHSAQWNVIRIAAAAFAEIGDFDTAIEAQGQALQIAPEASQPFCRVWLENYQNKVPFRLQGNVQEHQNSPKITEAQQPRVSLNDTIRESLTELLSQDMVLIEGGSFDMGADRGLSEFDDEKPVHSVTVGSFWICKYEVTNRLWALVMDGSDVGIPNPQHPVESVSWQDCNEFIKRLNQIVGADIYRLPTEMEWEYMAGAGATSDFCFGDSTDELREYGWYAETSQQGAHPVGGLLANRWGIFDVHGNVAEWCAGKYGAYPRPRNSVSAPNRPDPFLGVLRGGGWASASEYCRVSSRGVAVSSDRKRALGFRLATSQGSSTEPVRQSGVSNEELNELIRRLESDFEANRDDSDLGYQYAQALHTRALQEYQAKEYEKAISDLESALDALPRQVNSVGLDSFLMLGWLYATCPDDSIRDGERAVEAAKTACAIAHWEDWEALHVLAAAYAENDRFDQAISRVKHARSLAPANQANHCDSALDQFNRQEPIRADLRWDEST